MSGLVRRNDAIKRYMTLSRKLQYKPKNVNLRHMKLKQIEAAYEELEKTSKLRSNLVNEIKRVAPEFISRRVDSYDNIILKNLKDLPKKPYLSAISNYKLTKFLKRPVDEASINTTARSFIETIDNMKITSDYYLVMSYNTTTLDLDSAGPRSINAEDYTIMDTEYKVISNITEIKQLLEKIDSKVEEYDSQVVGYGSDTQLLYSILKTYDHKITLTWYTISTYKKVHSGAYFKWYNKTIIDLSRYQIFTQDYNSEKEDEINCLIYAFTMSRMISKVTLDNLKLSIFYKEIKARDLKTIAKQLGITIRLRYDPKQSASVFNKGCDIVVAIGLIDGHYFLDEPTIITKAAIDSYEEVKADISFPTIHPKKFKQKPLSSYQVIHTMFSKYRDSMFTPITLSSITNKQTVEKLIEYDELRAPQANCSCKIGNIRDIYELESLLANCKCKKPKHEFKDYGKLSSKKPFKGFYKDSKSDPNEDYDIWFIDTETFIKERLNYHVANTLCAIKYNERYDTFEEYVFFGLGCVKSFLGSLNKHSIIYAHNMAFDFRVFIDHLYDLQAPVESGTKLKQIQGKYQTGSYSLPHAESETKKTFIHLLFKDSYSFLPEKLSKLPAMLDLPTGDKEVFPYTLINEQNYDKCVPLSECRKHVKKGLRKAFSLNAVKIGAYNEDDKTVDMKKYSIHYCMQDTRILAHAFIKFRKQILEVCKLDIIPRLSLPQLADDFLKSKGVYNGCYAISGIAQDFIRRCCVGGRVMCNSNKKWRVRADKDYTLINGEMIDSKLNSGAIADFDAVSLYPSAMSMMDGYARGIPKVLTSKQISIFDSIKDTFDAYYVQIEVKSHTNDREFPLLSIKDKSGIRNFTNDIDGKCFYLDNIALEDLIEFQGVEYRVIRGYYFNDGVNKQINETINFMFNERLRLKKTGNNLQNVYKLLMNASYGKLIQKPITTSKRFVDVDDLRRVVAQNYKFISSYNRVNDNLFVIRENKSSINHFTACHIASNILSMSKRLMNRVMCLADDNDIRIYYQDTDSMHLHEQAIPILSELFKQKYNSDLIGKSMCQFHTDFSVSDNSATNIRAVESIFCGKKVYIDKLKYTNGYGNTKYDYHIRVKGIPAQSIRDFDADYMNTYERLFAGEALEFDLSAYCPLQIDRDYRARANTKCLSRKLQYSE